MNESSLPPLPSESPLRRAPAWLLGVALSLLAVACPEPGDLENPNQYCKPGQSVVGANNQVTGCTDSPASGGDACESACITALFTGTCVTCHSKVGPLGQLDLESPGFSARLKNQPASHSAVDNPQSCPMGDKLIDSANPTESWLLKKVSKQQGSCGTQMPLQGASPAEVTCVTEYVNCVSTQ